LNLDDSIKRALQNNQELLSIKEEVIIAKQRVRESKSLYYPKVDMNFNASKYLAENDFVLNQDFGSTLMRKTSNAEPDEFYVARAWLRQFLYTGGRAKSTLRLAKINLERAKTSAEVIRQDVIFKTTKAFFNCLLVKKQAERYRNGLSNAERILNRSRLNSSGRIKAKKIRNSLANRVREKERYLAKVMLLYLDTLGLELFTKVGLDGELRSKALELDLAKLLAWAREHRPELRQTQFQKEIDKLAVNLSLAERYPTVTLGAGYEYNDPSFPLDTRNWNATLNFNLPIFDGFSSRARIKQRKHQANRGRIQYTELEDRVQLEVRQAFVDYDFWSKEVLSRKKELEEIENLVEVLGKSKNVLDRLEAIKSLVEADVYYDDAVYNHIVAKAKLEQAVGKAIEESK